MTGLLQQLLKIGAIQFGQFEQPDGTFAPISINLLLVPSYPHILQSLATELSPLVKFDGLTHLLASPSTVPLATAISLNTGLPLVYPSGTNPETIEGAYDFNVPTVLLTDVLGDGTAERTIAKRAAPLGLDVKAVVTVIDLGLGTSFEGIMLRTWRRLPDLLPDIATPAMQRTISDWLSSIRV
jgi:uridine monophosphate synthetase